jgi:alkylation response protein AidB-like acyl-CoA dehydrogenase
VTPTPEDMPAELTAALDAFRGELPPGVDDQEAWGRQFDHGLAWVHLPVGHGGLGLPRIHQEDVDEALRAIGVPSNHLHNFVGVGMAGPTISAFGTDAQRARHLRSIFSCEEVWCQLFSEPTAGSDLASVATTAVRDGDEWVIEGTKIWTTLAHVARWGLLLARSDPHAPKHRGLTYFVCDMQAPGVEIRPIRQITGEAEFNEVRLHGVRIPDRDRLGPVDEGWRVTVTTLMNERLANASLDAGLVQHVLRAWRGGGRPPEHRDRVVRAWILAETLRLTTMRSHAQARKGGPTGPEGSILKLAVGAFHQEVYDLCLHLRGPLGTLIDDYDFVQPTTMGGTHLVDDPDLDLAKAFLNARSSTIGGGTTEIQRNVIAERVLGLPAAVDPTRGRPWSEAVAQL